jgi:hypothetical protein
VINDGRGVQDKSLLLKKRNISIGIILQAIQVIINLSILYVPASSIILCEIEIRNYFKPFYSAVYLTESSMDIILSIHLAFFACGRIGPGLENNP